MLSFVLGSKNACSVLLANQNQTAVFQPIRSEIKASRGSVPRIFPRLARYVLLRYLRVI